jgi:pyruvate/2-oxoacid:ferredoxin oxidoreductase alpha subunit
MMEPVEFPQAAIQPQVPDWAVTGNKQSRGNLITSLRMDFNDMEVHLRGLEARFRRAQQLETRAEDWYAEDAEVVLVGYGIVGRILKAVTVEARAEGLPVGLLRPITLSPFPTTQLQHLAERARVFLVVEMSNGQMVEDVRLAVNGARPVEFLNRMGGNVPSHDEVLAMVRQLARKHMPVAQPEEEQVAHV